MPLKMRLPWDDAGDLFGEESADDADDLFGEEADDFGDADDFAPVDEGPADEAAPVEGPSDEDAFDDLFEAFGAGHGRRSVWRRRHHGSQPMESMPRMTYSCVEEPADDFSSRDPTSFCARGTTSVTTRSRWEDLAAATLKFVNRQVFAQYEVEGIRTAHR